MKIFNFINKSRNKGYLKYAEKLDLNFSNLPDFFKKEEKERKRKKDKQDKQVNVKRKRPKKKQLRKKQLISILKVFRTGLWQFL